MESQNHLVAALNTIISTRRSCQKFKNQLIDEPTLISILKSANQCPSSFGLEPWKILVIKNQEIKKIIQKFCDNQEQVASCSHLFIVLAYKGKMFAIDSPWMVKRAKEKRNLKDNESYLNFYQKIFLPYMRQVKDWDEWSIRQSYILLQTMLLIATAHNLVSAPMEGSKLNKVVSFLEEKQLIKEKDSFICPFIIALGYSENNYQARTKKHSSIEETFTIIN